MLYQTNPKYQQLWDALPAVVRPEPRIVLDCIHLDPDEFADGGRTCRECLKGHGDVSICDKPRKCGPMCPDYEKAVKHA